MLNLLERLCIAVLFAQLRLDFGSGILMVSGFWISDFWRVYVSVLCLQTSLAWIFDYFWLCGILQFLRGLGPCMCRLGLACQRLLNPPLPHVQATFFLPHASHACAFCFPTQSARTWLRVPSVIGTPYQSRPLCQSCTSLQKNAQPRTPPITTLPTR